MTAQLKIENGTPLIIPADHASRLVQTEEMVEEIIAGVRREREGRAFRIGRDEEEIFPNA
jgi:hypothetical protein